MDTITWRERSVQVALVVMGLVTATPALALVDVYALEWTYGVSDPDPMVTALLQHRGMLQLLLGAVLVWAAFFRPVRLGGAVSAIVGKSTFLLLILPDDALREDLALFSTVFDLTCIVLLGVLAGYEIKLLRDANRPLAAV